AGLFEIGNVEGESGAFFLRVIGKRAIGNEFRVIVAIGSSSHLQRRKNIVRGKFPEGFSAYAFHDNRKQKESRVAVQPLEARIEIQGFLANDEVQRVVVGRDIVYVYSREFKKGQIIAQPTGVIQQMKNGDFLAVVGEFGNVLTHVVVDREFPL